MSSDQPAAAPHLTGTSSKNSCLFLDFLITIPPKTRQRLLQKPSCAFFIYRMLPPIAQQTTIQLIWKGSFPTASDVEETKEIEDQVKLLKDLGLVHRQTTDGKLNIDTDYKRSYMYAAMLGAAQISSLVLEPNEGNRRGKDVEKKAVERWDCILRYLALPSEENTQAVSETTRNLFKKANFTSGGDTQIEITTFGFQFLLLSPVKQMWTYVIEYLKLEMSQGQDIVEVIEPLIQIVLLANRGFKAERECYQIDANWTEPQNELLNHLRELGVIFIRKRKDGVFFLTQLLTHLATNETIDDVSAEKVSNGKVIVETNFRVYAYTSSLLQLAIIALFTEMTYRFQDMSVGMITRESVRGALQHGITAAQIISFLRANAHPQCIATSGPVNCLPITVADQIRLWEDERRRMNLKDAYIYSHFESEDEFHGVCEYARQQNILLWSDNQQKLVIVNEDGHELVRQWYKREKSKTGAGGEASSSTSSA
ncbi:General transcription factor IIH subunit 4 [Caenorhabditis elegans]|uniref:General transcription factor IIH subunit 4 n=2 Tax=Caenorhabditis elegans TaxID=6239 RepID=Q9NA35_CAEEL|nr:General transcription factor IIH subunit 4 [Caenorhabditis elegans]CAB70230.2 General transcription factor IIH subunit 4 [Caenorhabditis elegans]|eukprot:NP_001255863.1 General transcription factor IIH subunit 4 [Caenorhabditis elegans]